MVYEFLPLCDVLFNIISLASYFCDVVFDVVTAYTLYDEDKKVWFIVALGCILFSLVASQLCSFVWYLCAAKRNGHERKEECNTLALLSIHVLQAGVLFRYFRLFIPVDLRYVKNDVRDLCILRLVHAFCEAAPMLLVQLYLIWQKESLSHVSNLNIVSTALSLFSVCWALASFNKNVRRHNVHRLVLTWLGVIFQLLWRLGTISSRSLALTVYATLYHYWVLLVIALHWASMFLWLILPKNVFHGEKMPILKKLFLSMLIAFCYIFCYINLQDVNPRQKMLAFYLTMVLENTLLVSVWLSGLSSTPWYKNGVTALIFITFFLGMIFMALYYRHFHVRRLRHTYQPQDIEKIYACTGCQLGECSVKSHKMPSYPNFWNEYSATPHCRSDHPPTIRPHTKLNNPVCSENGTPLRPPLLHREPFSVPGVFNCRLNAAIKRKKKKPTTFVPTPIAALGIGLSSNTRLQHPFWKRPLPPAVTPTVVPSDHEGSVGSRINIQQKLQEKKQQQIAELRKIEEEIRAGKLKRPPPSDLSDSGTLRQPIPRAKKQPWLRRPDPHLQYPYVATDPSGAPPLRKPRSQTPEILLAPHYIDNTRIYYEYQDSRWKYGNNYHLPSDDMSGSSLSKHSARKTRKAAAAKAVAQAAAVAAVDDYDDGKEKTMYKSYRIPSDLDSQISLPRSYTLPREFKYHRRPKPRKTLRHDHFLASTNSSDGDVDSCGETDTHALSSGGAVVVSPGHSHRQPPHHHYYHYHHQTTLHPHLKTASEGRKLSHSTFHRKGVTNTHETKL